MSKIIILIIADGPPIYNLHKEAQMQTWAREDTPDIKIRWLQGNSYSQPSELKNRILWLNCYPDFNSILEKRVLGLQWILDNEIFDWVILTNTSTYFRINKINKLLSRFPTDYPIVAGKSVPYFPKNLKWGNKRTYLQGSGIYVNYAAALKIANLDYFKFGDTPDDLALSDYIGMNKIEIRKMPVCNFYIHHLLFSSCQVRVKSREYPKLPAARMRCIHRIYTARYMFVKIYYLIKLELEEIKIVNKSPRNIFKYAVRIVTHNSHTNS